MDQPSPPGRIEISRHAIATLVAEMALQCYGVVGLTGKTRFDDWRKGLLNLADVHHGVNVSLVDGAVTVDLYVIVEFGTRISEVARSLMHRVEYTLEQNVGLPVTAVNVHVQDLRVSR